VIYVIYVKNEGALINESQGRCSLALITRPDRSHRKAPTGRH